MHQHSVQCARQVKEEDRKINSLQRLHQPRRVENCKDQVWFKTGDCFKVWLERVEVRFLVRTQGTIGELIHRHQLVCGADGAKNLRGMSRKRRDALRRLFEDQLTAIRKLNRQRKFRRDAQRFADLVVTAGGDQNDPEQGKNNDKPIRGWLLL